VITFYTLLSKHYLSVRIDLVRAKANQMSGKIRGLREEKHRGDGEKQELDSDTVFSALSNQRRRYVISFLLDREEPVNITELSRYVAARENGIPIEEVTHKQRKRVYIALHQNHLSQLEDMGLIQCGRSREAIELEGRASDISSYLDPDQEEHNPWPSAEAALVVAGGLLVSSVWFEVYPFILLPDLTYAASIVIALAILTAIRLYRAESDA